MEELKSINEVECKMACSSSKVKYCLVTLRNPKCLASSFFLFTGIKTLKTKNIQIQSQIFSNYISCFVYNFIAKTQERVCQKSIQEKFIFKKRKVYNYTVNRIW